MDVELSLYSWVGIVCKVVLKDILSILEPIVSNAKDTVNAKKYSKLIYRY